MKDKKKIYRKRIISIVILAAVLIVGGYFLGYALTPPNFNMHIAHELKQIEEGSGKIDMMFVGASRVYHSFIPTIFEEKLGYEEVYNFGAANAPYSATYYQLKNMAERYHPSRVVIGVTLDELVDEEWLRGKMVIWDRLNLKGKLEFLFGGLGFQNWKYTINAYRFRDEIDNISYNLSERAKLEETDYAPNYDGGYHYGGSGFVSGDTGCETGTIAIDGAREFSTDAINQTALSYLDKCIAYCQEQGIDVILVTPPTSMMRMYNMTNYQGVIDFYTEYAAQKGVDYYDLNLLQNREEILPDEAMYDYNHVNAKGAEVVSELLAEIILKTDAGEDVSGYFYQDLEEMKADVHRIPAVGCSKIWSDETEEADDLQKDFETVHLDLMSFHNEDVIPEYQIEILYSGEEEYELLIPWTTEEMVEIQVPKQPTKDQSEENHDFMIKIRARIDSNDTSEAVRYFNNWTIWEGYDIASTAEEEAAGANGILF